MFGQIIQTLFTGLSIFPSILGDMFSFKETISGIQDQMWAVIIGIPVGLVSLIGLVIGIVKFFKVNKN